jgi:hypothetical protein
MFLFFVTYTVFIKIWVQYLPYIVLDLLFLMKKGIFYG